ncbi:MAG: type III pantothenate kinase, partial [Longicatena sp.]
ISVNAENPKAVGSDRIVDAAGAYHEYGGPCLVVDFGTATTYDYVDERGNFEFGVITLGLETSAQAMWTQAAKLPEIEIKKPKSILNKTTTTSMQAGLIYGYIGQSEYIIKKFKEAIGSNMKVIATGGLGKIIYKNTDEIDVYDRDLTFKGLKCIYEKYTADKVNRK